jgi:Fe2+ transport system protein FeoA
MAGNIAKVSRKVPGTKACPLTLNELDIGEKARVVSIKGDRFLKKRLLDLGFVRGTAIALEKVAPLGDPMDFIVRGYHVCLRRNEAQNVYVEKPE